MRLSWPERPVVGVLAARTNSVFPARKETAIEVAAGPGEQEAA